MDSTSNVNVNCVEACVLYVTELGNSKSCMLVHATLLLSTSAFDDHKIQSRWDVHIPTSRAMHVTLEWSRTLHPLNSCVVLLPGLSSTGLETIPGPLAYSTQRLTRMLTVPQFCLPHRSLSGPGRGR